MIDTLKTIAVTSAIAITVLFIMGVAYILIPITIACVVIGVIFAIVKYEVDVKSRRKKNPKNPI